MAVVITQRYPITMKLAMNTWRITRMLNDYLFQCKECLATPRGKNEDHYEMCTCGAIAVSGGAYPKINTVYADAYRYYLDEEQEDGKNERLHHASQ